MMRTSINITVVAMVKPTSSNKTTINVEDVCHFKDEEAHESDYVCDKIYD